MIRIDSVRDPFNKQTLVYQVHITLGRADAMGLLPQDELIRTIDLSSMHSVLDHIQRAGIGKAIQLGAEDTEQALERLNLALEESPAPDFEWQRMGDMLGLDVLSRLLGTAVPSIRRYRSATRVTPDDVAARLHWLSLIAGDLIGAYNEAGIRQWFDRKRVQLGGKSPAELLAAPWVAGDPNSSAIRNLARALTASAAT